MELAEELKNIKTQLRLSMNGVASASMREKGLNYKLNFGVELPRLKSIASTYTKDHELAQALWKENIRECKIWAGLVQPVETFFPEIADIWIDDINNIEILNIIVIIIIILCFINPNFLVFNPKPIINIIIPTKE